MLASILCLFICSGLVVSGYPATPSQGSGPSGTVRPPSALEPWCGSAQCSAGKAQLGKTKPMQPGSHDPWVNALTDCVSCTRPSLRPLACLTWNL